MAKIQTRIINQLTDVALSKGWSGDNSYREEAREWVQNYISSFGIFLGFYNKVKGTTLSVEDALHNEEIVDQYTKTRLSITSKPATTTEIKPKQKSTKSNGYDKIKSKSSGLNTLIYNYIKDQNTFYTRSEIALLLDLKLSTVCGRVHELISNGNLFVAGIKKDPETNVNVELLGWR